MSKKKKIILAIVIPLVIIGGVFVSAIIFSDFGYAVGLMIGLSKNQSLDREQLQEVVYQDKIFRVFYEEPPTSFNSGHKILSLYNKDEKLLDEIKYGDHPLIIESVDGDEVNLLIPITFYERNDMDDINSWIDRNKDIGKYSINHRIFNDPATSTKDFKYPR